MSLEWSPTTPLGFAAFFALMWVGVSLLIATRSGWRSLAEVYRLDKEFEGSVWRLKSGRIGSANYSSCLTLGANERGMLLKVLLPFRLWHPPLFVPWSDVSVVPGKGWVFHYLDFRFAQVPETRIRLRPRLGTLLLSAGGRDLRALQKVAPDAA